MWETCPDCGIADYLERIGFAGTPRADLGTLSLLQRLHMTHVPYENLEILAGTPFELDIPSLYGKIVTRRRGGYCFELNGLFGWLLRRIGFPVVEHFGRWLADEPLEYPVRRHRILRVTADGREYLCDVGVGMTSPLEPLAVETGTVQRQGEEAYRIVEDAVNIHVVQFCNRAGEWENLYSFNDDPCIPIDFVLPHYYCTTHPDSMFRHKHMVHMRTDRGKNVITDATDPVTDRRVPELRIYDGGGVRRTLLRTEREYKDALMEWFGIDADA